MVLHLASSGSVVSVGPKDFQKIGATLIFRKNDRNETRTSGIARGRGGRSQVSISICLTDCLLYVKVFEIQYTRASILTGRQVRLRPNGKAQLKNLFSTWNYRCFGFRLTKTNYKFTVLGFNNIEFCDDRLQRSAQLRKQLSLSCKILVY